MKINRILLVLFPLFTTAIMAAPSSQTSLPITQIQQTQIRPAAQFTATGVDGKPVKLTDYKGKVILLNFWATWCPPCLAEIPDLIKIQSKYKNKVQIIGISMDQSSEDVKRMLPKAKFNYPIIMSDDKIRSGYGAIRAVPTTIVINKDQMIVESLVGFHNQATFEATLSKYLK